MKEKKKEKQKEKQNNLPSIWQELERTGHKIDVIETKKFRLSGGKHYWLLDPKTREVECISCSVRHGGILEAHLLSRYGVKDGVIYLDGEPVTEKPENFDPEENLNWL